MAGRQAKIVVRRPAKAAPASATTSASRPVETKTPSLVEPDLVYRDRSNVLQEVVMVDGQPPPATTTCDWCHRAFGAPYCGNGSWVGLTDHQAVRADQQRHLTLDYYGTYNCALAYCELLEKIPSRFNEARKMKAYLLNLYARSGGTGPLVAAKDPRLLAPRGPLSNEEYNRGHHSYQPVQGVECIPSTRQFLRQDRRG